MIAPAFIEGEIQWEFFVAVLVLTGLLVMLKLQGYIKWQWIWVFSPLWGVVGMIFLGIVYMIVLFLLNILS